VRQKQRAEKGTTKKDKQSEIQKKLMAYVVNRCPHGAGPKGADMRKKPECNCR